MPQNELLQYIEQLALPGLKVGGSSNTPPTFEDSTLVFSHLDWLTVRYMEPKTTSPDDKWNLLPFPENIFKIDHQQRGMFGYQYSAMLEPCGIWLWGGHQASMGSLLILGGTDLAILRYQRGMTDDDILHTVTLRAEKVTRLDFASNITEGHPGDCVNHWKSGNIVTKTRAGLHYAPMGTGKGHTLDVGSRHSQKFVRIYDKAAELKMLHTILTRIELQSVGNAANRLSKVMRKLGVKSAGKAAIKQHVDFPSLDWYQKALSGAADEALQLTPRVQGDFMAWLDEHVGPAILGRLQKQQHVSEIRVWLATMMHHVPYDENDH